MSQADLALKGMAALVTGGGSGIGLASARALLRDGASVTIVGRTGERLREAAKGLEADAPKGAAVQWTTCDVGDEEQVVKAVALAAKPAGGLHVAVANAGTGTAGAIFAMPVDQWRAVVDVNLTGTFLTFKHAGAAIRDAGGGSLVAISSIAGPLTHRFMSAYCASKAAIEMLVRVAADELGPANVRANAIRPGLVPTDMAMPLTMSPEIVEDYLDQMPLGRLGTVEDIASAVRWLAGPESSWVTGQCLGVDGGHTLRRGPRVDSMVEQMLGPEALGGLEPTRRRS